MKRIGVLSDTHGYWDARFAHHFAACDEIWHAGDIGCGNVIDELEKICPVRAVVGNIDGQDLRLRFPQVLEFETEGARVLLTHIGGYPGRYDARIGRRLLTSRPNLFVCGHSHILRVMYDAQLSLLHINPGAAGRRAVRVGNVCALWCVSTSMKVCLAI